MRCVPIAAMLLAALPTYLPAQDVAASAAEAPPSSSGFFLWTDNSISLLPYGYGFKVDPKEQSTFTFEHADENKIGDMFLFIDATSYHGSAPDSDTWYGEIGPRLSFGKMLDEDLSFNLFKHSLFEVKDVLLAAQYERGEDADAAEAALLGLGLNLDIREAGILGGLGKFNYVQLNLYARDDLSKGAARGFHEMQVTTVASYPFEIGRAHFLIDGYFDWIPGLGDKHWSFHLNPQFTLDVGEYWGTPKKLYAGLEVDWWWNKYQIPSTSDFKTNQQAVSFIVKYHL